MLSVGGMLVLPVLESLLALVVSIHATFAWGPLAWAHFSMLLIVLECLNQSEDLIDIATDR
jgi:hypothetical protein